MVRHLEGRALDDAHQNRGKPVVVLFRVAHDRADHGHIVVFDSAAQRESHHLFGNHADELRRVVQQMLPQFRWPVDFRSVPQLGRGIDRNTAFAALLGPPLRIGIEVLQGKTDRVHQLVAAGARFVFAMNRHLLAQRQNSCRSRRRCLQEAERSAAAPAAASPGYFPEPRRRV